MIKKLLAIIGLVGIALAAWPAWADGTSVQRLGTGVATAVAVSPDGGTLAVGTSVGVWFLSVATLAPLSFWDTGAWVQSVAYSTDGRYLRADDRFYDTTTATAALLAPADLKWLPRDCSPDGQRCLVLNLDNLIIRDQDTQIDTALLRTGVLFDAAWSPKGGTIYTVVTSGLQARDAVSGKLRRGQTNFFTGSLYGVVWSADGTRVGSGDQAWEFATGRPVERLACGSGNAPDNCKIPAYVMDSGNVLSICDPGCTCAPFCPSHWLVPHDEHTDVAGFSLDGKVLMTSGADIYTYRCPAGSASMPSSTQCQTWVSSTRLWDVATLHLLGQVPTAYEVMALSDSGSLLIGQTQARMEAWDWATGRQLWSVTGQFGYSNKLAVSPVGNFVATYSPESSRTQVELWRLTTGEHIATLLGHTAPDPWPSGRLSLAYGIPWYAWYQNGITGLAFSPDGRHLAASSFDGTVLVWPVP